jgi:protein-S-isoprenylcysteine O-methyltransferase Ste14
MPLTTAVSALAATSFVVYALAIRGLFSREHGVDRRMQMLQLLGTLSAAAHLWSIAATDNLPLPRAAAALLLYTLALVVFAAARRALRGATLTLAFSPDTPQQLLRDGIYARIRHPFYTAYQLTWLGGIVAAPGPLTIASSSVMAAYYWHAASLEEQKFAQSALATDYDHYRRTAGRFWPLPRRPFASA